MVYPCEICDIQFTRKSYLNRHTKKKHDPDSNRESKEKVPCPFCRPQREFSRDELKEHLISSHNNITSEYEKTCSVSDNVCIFRKYLHTEEKTIEAFCQSKSTVESIFNLLKVQLTERVVFRASIAITANYEIPDWQENDGEGQQKSADSDSFTLRSKGQVFNKLQSNRQIKNRIRTMLKGAANRNEDLLHRGSGWKFVNLAACDILLYQVKLM